MNMIAGAAAFSSAPAIASAGSVRSEIDALYAERSELAARSRELRDQYQAAEGGMPWWAQGGYQYLRGDGTWRTGTIVGWPAIDDGHLPSEPHRLLNKRPSPFEIREDFTKDLRRFGEKQRPAIRANYRKRMLDLVARLRRQRDEENKAGLPGLDAKLDAIGERLGEIDDQIENLEVESADVAQKAAALLLITSNYDRKRDDSFDGSAALNVLRPLLSGLIRQHADYAAANPDAEMKSMPFWSAA